MDDYYNTTDKYYLLLPYVTLEKYRDNVIFLLYSTIHKYYNTTNEYYNIVLFRPYSTIYKYYYNPYFPFFEKLTQI